VSSVLPLTERAVCFVQKAGAEMDEITLRCDWMVKLHDEIQGEDFG
jgi:hypothetical protein